MTSVRLQQNAWRGTTLFYLFYLWIYQRFCIPSLWKKCAEFKIRRLIWVGTQPLHPWSGRTGAVWGAVCAREWLVAASPGAAGSLLIPSWSCPVQCLLETDWGVPGGKTRSPADSWSCPARGRSRGSWCVKWARPWTGWCWPWFRPQCSLWTHICLQCTHTYTEILSPSLKHT